MALMASSMRPLVGWGICFSLFKAFLFIELS